MAYEKQVDLVLTGEVAAGFTLEQVKTALVQTFRRSALEIEELFSSTPFTVKRDLPESQVPQYLKQFERIGAVVRVGPSSAAMALIGAEAFGSRPAAPVADVSGPASGSAFSPPTPSAPPGTTTGTAPVSDDVLTCPKCGHVQRRRTLCLECGTDMPRFLEAQRASGAEKLAVAQANTAPEPAATPYRTPGARLEGVAAEDDLPPLFALSVVGRIGRLRYMAWGIPAIFALLLAIFLLFLGAASGHALNMIAGGIAVIAGFTLLLRVSILRLHDLDRSGRWVLIYFVPLLNVLLHLALMVVPGRPAPTAHGAPPRPNTLWVYIGAAVLGILYLFDGLHMLAARH